MSADPELPLAGMPEIPPELLRLPALSIRQPWAWLILHAGKRHENRNWVPWNPGRRFRGDFLIHAGKGCTAEEYDDACFFVEECIPGQIELPPYQDLLRGGIVGRAKVVDFVGRADSPWFTGPVALVFDDVQPLPFYPCRGALGFFHINQPATHE